MDKIFKKRLKRKKKLEARMRTFGSKSLPVDVYKKVEKRVEKVNTFMKDKEVKDNRKPWYKRVFNNFAKKV